MARPRLDDEERREQTVGVRVTAAEAAELRERAQAARLSMGAYLRRRALGQRVRIAAELRLGAAELRELNRIGVNLNQMARALNSRAVSSPAAGFVGKSAFRSGAGDREQGGRILPRGPGRVGETGAGGGAVGRDLSALRLAS